MTNSIKDLYDQIIHSLAPADRLRLATLLLNGLVRSDASIVDQSDTWTEQDQLDLINFSLQYADTIYSKQEDLTE